MSLVESLGHDLPAHGGALDGTCTASGLAGLRQSQSDRTRSLRVGLVGRAARGGALRTWPGQGYGIRGPVCDETPLSWDEVTVALFEMWQKSAVNE